MMLAIHFVPTEPAALPGTGVGVVSGLVGAVVDWTLLVWDKCASLFCVVAGLTWSLVAASWRVEVRRAMILFVVGVVLGRTLWDTEILSPLALMMLALHALRRGGTVALWGGLLGTLSLQPVLAAWLAPVIEADWLADGSHLASRQVGWISLRYYLIDGTYPVFPWLGFVISGALLARVDWRSARIARWLALAGVPSACLAHQYRVWSDYQWFEGELSDALAVTWDPVTSLPFFGVGLTSALATLGVLLWWQARGPVWFAGESGWAFGGLSAIGRLSLTHYLAHIALVFAPLTIWWPDEGWSALIGSGALIGYCAVAWACSPWWVRRYRRGPVEATWAWLAGSLAQAGNAQRHP